MLVISNNSPIRYLILLDCIHLLPALFSRVTIPAEVQAELQRPRTPAVVRAWIANPPAWVDIRQVSGTPIDLSEVCGRLLTTNFRIKDYIIHNVLARDAARKAAAPAQPPEPQET